MILDVKIHDRKSYLIDVASAKAGVLAIQMIFDLLKDAAFDFSVGSSDNVGNANTWAIEKLHDRFMFMFLSVVPMHGFEHGHGSVYMYKLGHDAELVDWPSVEFGRIPKHCLLSKEDTNSLLLKLARAENPEETAGFTFDADSWEHVC